MAALRWSCGEASGKCAVGISNFAPAFAIFRVINIAQNRKEPGAEIGPRDKGVDTGPGLHQGFLDEIVGVINIAAKGHREGTQIGDDRKKVRRNLRACLTSPRWLAQRQTARPFLLCDDQMVSLLGLEP